METEEVYWGRGQDGRWGNTVMCKHKNIRKAIVLHSYMAIGREERLTRCQSNFKITMRPSSEEHLSLWRRKSVNGRLS